MKKTILLLTIFSFAFKVGHSQTNVSGGIYTNTTWTVANSPYIVTDTVVVFPNVTLTIEPGVTVKFYDNVRLEIRQAKLIAVGSNTDSITFTSNSSTPFPGIWDAIWLNGVYVHTKFFYCNFFYANNGISNYTSYSDTLEVKNSHFAFDKTGIYNEFCAGAIIDSCEFNNNTEYGFYGDGSTFNNCLFANNVNGIYGHVNIIKNTRVVSSSNIGIQPAIGSAGSTIDNCEVINNQYGIVSLGGDFGSRGRILNSRIDSNSVAGIMLFGYLSGDTINNCQIKNNGIGILDTTCIGCYGGPDIITHNVIENNIIGIRQNTVSDLISCNKICNNASYDFYYNVDFNNNFSIPSNYWCSSDSATIRAKIYDGYVNINKGLVYFTPFDTTHCYLVTGIAITEISNQKIEINIFPNPFSIQTTLQTDNHLKNSTLTVYNSHGQTVKQIKNIFGQTITLSRENLPSGLYFVRLTDENKIITVDKLVIVDK